MFCIGICQSAMVSHYKMYVNEVQVVQKRFLCTSAFKLKIPLLFNHTNYNKVVRLNIVAIYIRTLINITGKLSKRFKKIYSTVLSNTDWSYAWTNMKMKKKKSNIQVNMWLLFFWSWLINCISSMRDILEYNFSSIKKHF